MYFRTVMFDSPKKEEKNGFFIDERDDRSAKYFVNEIISKQKKNKTKNIYMYRKRKMFNYVNGIKRLF